MSLLYLNQSHLGYILKLDYSDRNHDRARVKVTAIKQIDFNCTSIRLTLLDDYNDAWKAGMTYTEFNPVSAEILDKSNYVYTIGEDGKWGYVNINDETDI